MHRVLRARGAVVARMAGGLRGLAGGALACALIGCTGIPSGLSAVTGFEADRYLGTWYELARLDHSFERGLTHVRAEYDARADGAITVLNRGYDPAAGAWREARGTAWFRGDRSAGSLKVTFFWPFYGGYHIIALDKKDYRYAMVAGPSRAYLWILCREPALDPAIMAGLIAQAKAGGFATEDLIHVDHRSPVPPPAGSAGGGTSAALPAPAGDGEAAAPLAGDRSAHHGRAARISNGARRGRGRHERIAAARGGAA